MRIVVLDAYTLNPGDLNWDALQALGNVKLYDRTPPNEIVSRAKDADIVLTNKVVLNADTIAQLDQLRYIGVMATGFNVVDLQAAAERKIPVTNVPAYSTASVAQITMALILELCHHVGDHSASVHNGDWAASADFAYWKSPLIELYGKVMGIVGFGNIGQAVAKLAMAFGMKVIAHHKHPERDRMENVNFVDVATLFQEADIISLHCPLNDANKGFVNEARLKTMKPTAFLVNTSRGPLLNEADVAKALNDGIIAGAALDVLSQEPPSSLNPLLGAKNCIITPHIAWATKEARTRLMNTLVANIQAFQAGDMQNVVNKF
ncbi:glycerate dehydrogenase [Chitinophaga skermanii]|uniref:Glycerate dehydrogenase n=1 Tax=Chitinophaga skermanii TaxID=331697 RepID=A0A327Q5P5_9BACT|nr:D-2-hydroxyacid dehydrogenase [Chitinophaga skermanii]RAI99768.1 glycerate dehydrogenase [Chitinophaga skermanii]